METVFSKIRDSLALMKSEIEKTVHTEVNRNKEIAQSFVLRAAVNKTRETTPHERREQRRTSREERRAERLRKINEQ